MVFIPKDDQRLPDFFTITVNYLTGRKETIEVSGLQVIKDFNMYEIWTREDTMKVILISAIESIDYDKEWSKIVRIKEELAKKA